MTVTKDQIINGIASFVESEVIPMVDDKTTKIIASVAIKYIKSNKNLLDKLFSNPLVSSVVKADENGKYDLGEFFEFVEESIKQYGPFPVTIPPIPLISPDEKILSFDSSDVSEIKKYIERSN